MECYYCQGNMIWGAVSYTANRKGYHLIIDDMPAWICEQCGEPLFDESTVDAIQKMLRQVDSQLERLVISSMPL
jgi:YgiT-type zinc finger domain-containing protein